MKRLSQIFIFLFLTGMVLFSSCRDEGTTVGSKWFTSSFKNIQTDTCTVLLSTALSDSLATSGDSICQVGIYKDNVRGKITSSFFTEYTVSTTNLDNDNRYKYDSIRVRLLASGDYVGDTLSTPQKINVHVLKKNVELDDKGYLYNRSSVSYDPTPIATISYTPRPSTKSRDIAVRLPDEIGQSWFDQMRKGNVHFNSQSNFRDYFKGLAFIPENSANNMTGFQVNDSSFVVFLYYHDITNTSTGDKAIFTPRLSNSFDRIDFDRSNTKLSSLVPGVANAVSSYQTNHIAHLQGLTGMYILIDFPHLNNIMGDGEMVSIESAYLQLYPVKGEYGPEHPLPSKLSLYTTDANGATQDVVYNLSGTSVQTGSLVEDYGTYKDTYYTFDITSFLQGILGKIGSNKKMLKLLLPNREFFSTCSGSLFGDMQHDLTGNNNVKLTILYKTYNEKQ